MGYTYILECSDGSYYVGSTRDLERRLAEHEAGVAAIYTRTRRPVRLAWFVELPRIDDAFALEKRIQGWSHAKRRLLIEEGIDAVRGWSARSRSGAVPREPSG